MKQKTPMQELLDILIEKKCNTFEAPLSDTRVALDFAIEQTRLMLEKEKEVMCGIYDDAIAQFDTSYIGEEKYGEQYFEETFNTKEK
jgi:hypothetical protein